jgi:hypothetical protein
MSITAKVISTGEFFHATCEIADGDNEGQVDIVLPLSPTKRYVGSRFPGYLVGQSDEEKLRHAIPAEYMGDQLEVVPGYIWLGPPIR